jgi:hypothetical protein
MKDEDKKVKEAEEKLKILNEIIKDKDREIDQRHTNTNIYYGVRFIQIICIGIAVFGALWKGTEVMNLDTPGFMMVYGGLGAISSEIIARVFKKKI